MTDEEIAREFGLEPTEALSAALRRVREETLEEAAHHFDMLRGEDSDDICWRAAAGHLRFMARASNAPKEGE